MNVLPSQQDNLKLTDYASIVVSHMSDFVNAPAAEKFKKGYLISAIQSQLPVTRCGVTYRFAVARRNVKLIITYYTPTHF